MLARVNQFVGQFPALKFSNHGRHFDKVGAGADDALIIIGCLNLAVKSPIHIVLYVGALPPARGIVRSVMSNHPFIIRSRHACDRLTWDAFVDSSDEAWLWHRYDLQEALAARGRVDLSFAVSDGEHGDILAVVPLQLVEGRLVRLVPWNGLNSLGAPALKNDLGEKRRQQVAEFIREHLIRLAAQHRAFEINLAHSQLAPAFRGERCPRINPLLDWGCENTLTQAYILDLRQPEAALWAGYSKTTRNELNRIAREPVEIREATPNDVDLYYQLHCETYDRTGVPPHPKEYFHHIFETFLPLGMCSSFF